jgi:hypothetical protein
MPQRVVTKCKRCACVCCVRQLNTARHTCAITSDNAGLVVRASLYTHIWGGDVPHQKCHLCSLCDSAITWLHVQVQCNLHACAQWWWSSVKQQRPSETLTPDHVSHTKAADAAADGSGAGPAAVADNGVATCDWLCVSQERGCSTNLCIGRKLGE